MHQRYKDARSLVAMEQPFFATVLFHLKEQETREIKTMATDGKTIFVNPDFVEKLTLQETAGVIIHEVCHVIFMHHLRLAEMDNGMGLTKGSIAKLWNCATDFAINFQLRSDNVKLPEPHLYDAQFEGLNAEEIYDRLLKDADVKQMGGSCIGEVLPGVGDDGEPLDSGGIAKEKIEVTSTILQAGEVAKQMGSLPGFAKELIKALTESKVDWREALWQHVSRGKEFGFNWSNPNRRYHASRIVMPSFGAKGMPALNCIIDTSGSTRSVLPQFMAELRAAVETMGIEDVITVMCDTRVVSVQHHCAKDGEITFEAVGFGGTDMNPAFDELRQHRPAPTILFSDMEIPPLREFDCPTLFCRCGNGTYLPDWGTLIDVR